LVFTKVVFYFEFTYKKNKSVVYQKKMYLCPEQVNSHFWKQFPFSCFRGYKIVYNNLSHSLEFSCNKRSSVTDY
jgi:hypothetical protein